MDKLVKKYIGKGLGEGLRKIEEKVNEVVENPEKFVEKVYKTGEGIAIKVSEVGKEVADGLAKKTGRSDFEELLQEIGLKASEITVYESSQKPKNKGYRVFKSEVMELDLPEEDEDVHPYVHRKIDAYVRNNGLKERCSFAVYEVLGEDEVRVELYEKFTPKKSKRKIMVLDFLEVMI